MTVTDNVTLVGNVLLNNHVLGNFSTSNYAYNSFVPHLPDYNSWEVSAKIITSSGYVASNVYDILVCGDVDARRSRNCGFLLRIYQNKINFVVERYTNSYQDVADLSSDTIQNNTEYIVKGRFTGSRYELEVNGTVVAYKDATWKGLYNASRMPHLDIGIHSIYVGEGAFIGSIDLTKCYFKANGSVLWNGVERSKTYYNPARKNSGFYIPARKRNVQIVNTSILNTGSGSMGSDYTMSFDNQNQRPYTVDVMPLNTANTWEWRTKFTYTSSGTYSSVIGHNNSDFKAAPYVQIINGEAGTQARGIGIVIPVDYLHYVTPADNYSKAIDVNTPYYLKFGFSGTEYYLELNTEGWDAPFTRYCTHKTTAKCYVETNTKTSFMSRYNAYLYGTIDFKETRLFINGQVYWEYITNKIVNDYYIPTRKDNS